VGTSYKIKKIKAFLPQMNANIDLVPTVLRGNSYLIISWF